MYSTIINPNTGKQVKINSFIGRNIIKNYLSIVNLKGGSKSNLNIYYINLKRSPDRNKYMKQYFEKYNIKATRIEAVDGTLFDDKNYIKKLSTLLNIPIEKLNKDYFLKKSNFNCLEKEEKFIMTRVGCMLSHYLAIKTAYDNNLDNILILEDDIIINEDLNKWYNSINIDFECDMLYLGGNIKHINTDPYFDENKKKKFIKINSNYTKIFGTQGYFLHSKESINKLYSILSRCFIDGKANKKNIKHPNRILAGLIDRMYVNYVQPDNKCYLVNPCVLKHNFDFESTISDKPDYTKNTLKHRRFY